MREKRRFVYKIAALLSCLILMIVLLITGMYALFTDIMEQQSYLFCRTMLGYSLGGEEGITSSVKNLHEQMFLDNRIFRLTQYSTVDSSDLLSGLKQMTAYRKSNTWVDSIYLYNPSNQRVYVSSDNAPYSTYEFSGFYDASAAEIIEDYQSYEYMQPIFRQITVTFPTYQTINLVSFIRYNTLGSSNQSEISIINVRLEDYFQQITKAFQGVFVSFNLIDRNGISYFPDEEGKLFSDYSQRPVVRKVLDNWDKEYIACKIDGKREIIFWQDFFSGRYRLVVSASISNFYPLFNLRERRQLFIILTAGFLSMFGLFWFLSHKLLIVFNEQLLLIRQAETEQREETQQKKRQLQMQFLYDGGIQRDHWQKVLSSAGLLPKEEGPWIMLLFAIDQYRTKFLKEYVTVSEQNLLKYGVCNILGELLAPYGLVFNVYENDGTIVSIISSSQTEQYESLRQLLEQVISRIHQALNISLSVFISDPYFDFYQSSDEYTQMRDLLPYGQLLPMQSVTWVYELKEREQFSAVYPKTEVAEIIRDLMNARFSKAIQGTQILFSSLTSYSYKVYRKYLMQFVLEMDDALQKFLTNNSIENGLIFDTQVFHLTSLETAAEISEELTHIILRVQQAYCQRKDSRQVGLSLQVQELLEQNYPNPNYSLGDVAETIGMSAAYIGRLFKRQTCQTVSEYLVSIRIRYAIKLLEETDMPIKDIAEKTGFQDLTYFYRIFKNSNGIPPAQYRRNHRNEKYD